MYLLILSGRGGRSGCSCGGGVKNGGLWWLEEMSKMVVGGGIESWLPCVVVVGAALVASPKDVAGLLALRWSY